MAAIHTFQMRSHQNNDGNNDEFEVYSNCELQNFHLEVYDRFGGRVFISKDINEKWDGTIRGKNAMNAVYVWVLRYSALDERGILEERIESGDVTLIR